jgi:hypothetical protein
MQMKYQTPAEGIMKTNEWGNSKVYRVSCECTDPNHDHNVWIEAEDTGVSVTIFTTVKSNWWSKTRWHAIWTLLTKGYIDTEASLILSEQQALNYAETLQSAIEDVKLFKEERLEKSKTAKLAEQGDCV